MRKLHFSQGLLIGCMMSAMALVQAESLLKKEQDYSLAPKMSFQFDLDKTRQDKYQLLDDDALSSLQQSVHQPLLNETRLDQFDAGPKIARFWATPLHIIAHVQYPTPTNGRSQTTVYLSQPSPKRDLGLNEKQAPARLRGTVRNQAQQSEHFHMHQRQPTCTCQ